MLTDHARLPIAAALLSLFLQAADTTHLPGVRAAGPGLGIHSAEGLTLSQDNSGKPDAIDISISLSESTVTPKHAAKVVVKLGNRTGHALGLKELNSVRLKLSKFRQQPSDYKTFELFVSSFPLGDGEIKNGASYEFEVDLTKLNWADYLSSSMDSTNTPNLFNVVPRGDYYLFIEVDAPRPGPAKDDDDNVIELKSDEVSLKIDGQ